MMRWTLHPLRLLKSSAAVASIFTMCISPIAQGKAAQTQSQLINDFVKSSGLSKGTTVGDYWKLVRHAYPQPLQGQLDAWVQVNRNEMMPKVEVTAVKDRNGIEQFRLGMTGKGQSATVTLTGDDEKPLKFNNTVITAKELTSYKSYNQLFAKVAAGEPKLKSSLPLKPMTLIGRNPVLSFKEYKSLTPRQRAEYLYRVRLAVEAAQRVYKTKFGAQAANDIERKYQFAVEFLFGADAEAKASSLTGKPCVYAGYLTLYGENGTCGGQTEGDAHFKAAQKASMASCPGADVPCQPMVYGYQSDGSNYCIPNAQRKFATSLCNKASPKDSPQDKKHIIESYLAKRGKKVNLVLDVDGKVSESQYGEISGFLTDLNKYIDEAVGECDRDPLLSVQKQRPDQKSACEAIRVRAFGLQQFATNPVPVILPATPPNPPTVSACDDPSRDINPDGTCGQCKAGSEQQKEKKEDGTPGGDVCMPGAIVAVAGGGDLPGAKEEPKEKEEDKKCKGLICPLPLFLIGALVVGGAIWAITKKKKKKHDDTYVPPIAVDPGTPTTPVEPPVTVPDPVCVPPKVIQNNQCVLIIDTLPPPATEGGTLIPAPDMGAGVR
jgi:hypothetical protein